MAIMRLHFDSGVPILAKGNRDVEARVVASSNITNFVFLGPGDYDLTPADSHPGQKDSLKVLEDGKGVYTFSPPPEGVVHVRGEREKHVQGEITLFLPGNQDILVIGRTSKDEKWYSIYEIIMYASDVDLSKAGVH